MYDYDANVTSRPGGRWNEWKMRADAYDNHWFDGVVGAAPCGVRFTCLGNPIAYGAH